MSGVFTRRQDSMVYIRQADASSDPSSSSHDTPRYLLRHDDFGWVLSSSLVTNNVTTLSKALTESLYLTHIQLMVSEKL